MPVNPLKEFFKRKKTEVKFARAGPGHSLSSDNSGPSGSSAEQASARQAAAEAAMKRFNKDSTKPAQRPRMTASSTSTTTDQTSETTTTDSLPKGREKAPTELPIVDGIPERRIQMYSTEELAQRIKQPDIDDDFFRLTIEDAKLFKLRYDEERARNDILKTSEMRKREAEAKKPTTNLARLRFKLPNNLVLEASFSGDESLSLIRDWLMSACFEKAGLELKSFDVLFGLRPFKEADYGKSVKQLGLLPATTLTIVPKNT